jgi:hypothetical protein
LLAFGGGDQCGRGEAQPATVRHGIFHQVLAGIHGVGFQQVLTDIDTAFDEQISGPQRLTDARHHQDVHADVEHSIDARLDLVPQAGFGIEERLDVANVRGGSG